MSKYININTLEVIEQEEEQVSMYIGQGLVYSEEQGRLVWVQPDLVDALSQDPQEALEWARVYFETNNIRLTSIQGVLENVPHIRPLEVWFEHNTKMLKRDEEDAQRPGIQGELGVARFEKRKLQLLTVVGQLV